MKNLITIFCLFLLLASCFPVGVTDKSELWTGTMKAKVGEFPEVEGSLTCKLLNENNTVSGKCDFGLSAFGRTSITKYLLKGTLDTNETKFQLAEESQPTQPVEIIGTYVGNLFTGKGSLTVPFGSGSVTTNYTMTLRRQTPVVPVRDTTYDASGRWDLQMDLTDGSNGRLRISGSCSFSDNGGDLRASCSLTDGANRISPTFSGKRSGTRAALSYTSLLQDIVISFSGDFTGARSFSGRGSLRDLRNSYSGSVSMSR